MISKMCLIFFVLNYLSLLVPNDSARILAYFPVASISHQIVFRPLTQELAKRGHELVIITPDPAFPNGKTPDNITEIDVHDISYQIWIESFVMKVDGNSGNTGRLLKQGMIDVIEAQLLNKEVQNVIKSKQHFDLLLIEACVRPGLIMSHIFKAPVIQISSFGATLHNYEFFGAPTHPLLYPETLSAKIFNLTIWEKVNAIKKKLLISSTESLENKMLKSVFGSDAPSVRKLNDNVDMLFLNIHSMWELNRPVPPGVIHMGGLHQKPLKDIPSDLKSFLDMSLEGVIYMSFGTNIQTSQLPPEKIQMFNKVFSKLPYDVLWKWDKDTMPGKANNVKISKWLPQSDLLRHPKIKLFITQAGLQSTDEAITAGVPLIAFPMLGDQWYNAELYLHYKIGLHFDIKTITEDVLEKSIKNIVKDQIYRKNVNRLRDLMYDQPQTSLERAVWWTEYVIRHGGAKHLRSPAANMSWAEYLMLDVVFTLITLSTLLVIVLYKILRIILSYRYFKSKKRID